MKTLDDPSTAVVLLSDSPPPPRTEEENDDGDQSPDGDGAAGPSSTPPLGRNGRDPPVFAPVYASDLEVFKCGECPYETYNVAALASHRKSHKLYECDVCRMKFSHAANMRRHRMRHTGFKPFECRVCLKRFFRKDHLMEHLITHSKQQLPFRCPMCDKSFNRQVYFKAHLQSEHWNLPGDKICAICGHKAATIKGAKLHYTTRHARAANTVNSSSPANSRQLAGDDLLAPVRPWDSGSTPTQGTPPPSTTSVTSSSPSFHTLLFPGPPVLGPLTASPMTKVIKTEPPASDPSDDDDDDDDGVATLTHSDTCSPNSTQPAAVAAAFASAFQRQVTAADLTITPLGGCTAALLACVHCGIGFPDQTLYFLHKGVHSDSDPWKCNICGETCRDKYDFNTHILSKAHQ